MANILIAAIVPFLSVLVAEYVSEHNARRRDVRKVFLGLRTHMYDFRRAFLDFHPQSIIVQAVEAAEANARKKKLEDCVKELDADCLDLGLFFDRDADDLGRRIRALAEKANLLLGSGNSLPSRDVCDDGLAKDIQKIAEQMKDLWYSEYRSRLLSFIRRLSKCFSDAILGNRRVATNKPAVARSNSGKSAGEDSR